MTETLHVNLDASGLGAGVDEAAAHVERAVNERIVPAALLVEDAFFVAGRSIQSNLARAAETGALSLRKLTKALTRDLGDFAIDALVRRPVEGLVKGLLSAPFAGTSFGGASFGGASFGGSRAAGGFAAAGRTFLVGERGPELFTPAASGMVSPLNRAGARGVTVNITLPGVTDAESFRRSETQIAAALARAVGRGRRNL